VAVYDEAMQALGHWLDDADRSAVVAHRTQQLHGAMLDHAIWQRLLRQAGPGGMYEAVQLDRRLQLQVFQINQAFLAAHEHILRALQDELIAAGGEAPAPLGGIFAPQECGRPDDLPVPAARSRAADWMALLARAEETHLQAQHLLSRAAQTVQGARRACAQTQVLVRSRHLSPGSDSALAGG
jgi:hypothetical protein